MVSFSLLSRGLFHFTVSASNVLPYIKHGMDVYYSQKWNQGPNLGPCSVVKFNNVCFDDFWKSDFSLGNELGCCLVIILLTFIMTLVQTLMAIYFLFFNCNKKEEEFISGAEDGCCGGAAILISFVTFDAPPTPAKPGEKTPGKLLRRGIRGTYCIFQFPILIALVILMQLTQAPESSEGQKTSILVLVPVFLLNLTSFIENIGECVVGLW